MCETFLHHHQLVPVYQAEAAEVVHHLHSRRYPTRLAQEAASATAMVLQGRVTVFASTAAARYAGMATAPRIAVLSPNLRAQRAKTRGQGTKRSGQGRLFLQDEGGDEAHYPVLRVFLCVMEMF